ncbi:MAG: hypothetical protein R2824_08805 [Saprospiraceae bacterium]
MENKTALEVFKNQQLSLETTKQVKGGDGEPGDGGYIVIEDQVMF